jgi:hypothetical protein
MATNKPQSFTEQSKALALLEMAAHPEQVLDRARPLSPAIESNLEDLIKELGYIWLLQKKAADPQFLR